MARKRMVTRTVQSTVATVMVADTEAGTMGEQIITLGKLENFEDKTVLKAVTKHFATAGTTNLVPVKVISTEVFEQLYGMPEEQFIALATVLPPREAEVEDEE